MSFDSILPKIRQKMAGASQFGHSVLFDLGDDGFIHIDGSENPATLATEEKEADVTVETSAATLEAILDGTQDPNIAFLMRKIKVRGDMRLAIKLNAFLDS